MTDPKNTRKQIITFLILTTVISTGIFIWMFSGARDSIVAVIPMMYTPGISAILTTLIHKGKLREYGWKLGKARYLIYSFLLPVVVSLLAYGSAWITEFADFTTEEVIHYKWAEMLGFNLPAPFIAGFLSKMVFATLIAVVFVFGEEVGWSGFLTPKLRRMFSVPVTSLLVGIFWAVWHFPAIIGGFYGTDTPLWISLPGFAMVLVGASFIRTVLIEKSKSLWVGVILHAGHNVILMSMFLEMTVFKGQTYYFVSETGPFMGLVYILVAILFWKMQTRRSKI